MIGSPNRKRLTIERIPYPARKTGTTIVATRFKPFGFETSRQYAAIFETHTFGGVKLIPISRVVPLDAEQTTPALGL